MSDIPAELYYGYLTVKSSRVAASGPNAGPSSPLLPGVVGTKNGYLPWTLKKWAPLLKGAAMAVVMPFKLAYKDSACIVLLRTDTLLNRCQDQRGHRIPGRGGMGGACGVVWHSVAWCEQAGEITSTLCWLWSTPRLPLFSLNSCHRSFTNPQTQDRLALSGSTTHRWVCSHSDNVICLKGRSLCPSYALWSSFVRSILKWKVILKCMSLLFPYFQSSSGNKMNYKFEAVF